MSDDLIFNLHLITSDIDPQNGDEMGDSQNSELKSHPLTYLISPKGDQIILSVKGRQLASFIINDLPPFLARRKGLYLGDIYSPTIKVNNQNYFMRKTSRENIYDLVEPKYFDSNDAFFSFALLTPDLKWNAEDTINNIYFENFTLDN